MHPYIKPEEFVSMTKDERYHYIVHVLTSNQSLVFAEMMKTWALEQRIKVKEAKYSYLVTFTTKPGTDPVQAEAFLCSQADRACLYINTFKYCKEHADDNLHFHVLMTTTQSIKKEAFKHWTKIYGHVDFKPIKPGTESNVESYIQKETNPIILK